MSHDEFDASLGADLPPNDCTTEVAALWWLKKGSWQNAHDLVDAAPGPDAAWIHALLHRMEGDQMNANYWYARAGRARQGNTITQELAMLLDYFLE